MTFRVGDVIIGPKDDSRSYELFGQLLHNGHWSFVRFERSAIMLIVDVTKDVPPVLGIDKEPIDFEIELFALEIGYRFKFRGLFKHILTTCDVIRRENYSHLRAVVGCST